MFNNSQSNPYIKDVKQTNGCRVWENPLIKVPTRRIEIFIKNLPNDLFESDILPHFERFGPIYQLRLLIDYDNYNRGFAYLIYANEKSALCALDVMGYFIIKPGVMIEVQKSQERSNLLALNVPSSLTNDEIESGFLKLYSQLMNVQVNREKNKSEDACSAILAFPDHLTALKAKRWSGIGSVNMWNRNIKILWARSEQIENIAPVEKEAKHVLFHNVPEHFDPDDFGNILCSIVSPLHIVSIRPMWETWLVEFTHSEAAYEAFVSLKNKIVGGREVTTEWVTPHRLKAISFYADFDFELRCICIGNYWDPPIFIYGRIIPFTQTQVCSVLIKDNQKNQFTTFFIEMFCDELIDIHSRVCEILVLIIMEMKELPKKNIVIKCDKTFATIVGAITELDVPMLQISTNVIHKIVFLYLEEVYALSKMCFFLITSTQLDDIYKDYKQILKDKNIQCQIINGIFSDGNLLGCIDPIYRSGKPLKYQMDSRHMILALCDRHSLSNITFNSLPALTDIRVFRDYPPLDFKLAQVEMIPLVAVQRSNIHYTFRPYIEFNQIDTFTLQDNQLPILQWIQEEEEENDQQASSVQANGVFQPVKNLDAFDFGEFMNCLEQ